MKVRVLGVIIAVAGTLLAAPAAQANVNTGHQNPHFVVVAQIAPNHIDVGERVSWSATILNVSHRQRCLQFEIDYSAPDSGEGVSGDICLAPDESFTFGRSPKSRVGGEYLVKVRAWDSLGTSHARARAFA